ncbi:MAG: class I SAM-dependent methyltransferase [Planctomycetales bacterium]|nr:class I SAM-dependent methyltransferase [Planctomycetales bacterium]
MAHDVAVQDFASKQHWDQRWQDRQLPLKVNPANRSLHNYQVVYFDRVFQRLFEQYRHGGANHHPLHLMEVGCARSTWLPYFANRLGCQVQGLDYSEHGCHMAEQILRQSRVDGQIHCADLFAPPAELQGQFDVVVSFGVVEHFSDTSACLSQMARLAKPGGMLITIIPNMQGLPGLCQKWLDKDVYNIHVPLSAADLATAHIQAGLQVSECRYHMSAGLQVVSLESWPANRWKRTAQKAKSMLTRTGWWLDRTFRLPANRITSPCIICTAIKPLELS